jgi:hypothetical protein
MLGIPSRDFSETSRGHRSRASLSAIRAKEPEKFGIDVNKTINDLSRFCFSSRISGFANSRLQKSIVNGLWRCFNLLMVNGLW